MLIAKGEPDHELAVVLPAAVYADIQAVSRRADGAPVFGALLGKEQWFNGQKFLTLLHAVPLRWLPNTEEAPVFDTHKLAELSTEHRGEHVTGTFLIGTRPQGPQPTLNLARAHEAVSSEPGIMLLVDRQQNQGAFFRFTDDNFVPLGGFYESQPGVSGASIIPWTGVIPGAESWLNREEVRPVTTRNGAKALPRSSPAQETRPLEQVRSLAAAGAAAEIHDLVAQAQRLEARGDSQGALLSYRQALGLSLAGSAQSERLLANVARLLEPAAPTAPDPPPPVAVPHAAGAVRPYLPDGNPAPSMAPVSETVSEAPPRTRGYWLRLASWVFVALAFLVVLAVLFIPEIQAGKTSLVSATSTPFIEVLPLQGGSSTATSSPSATQTVGVTGTAPGAALQSDPTGTVTGGSAALATSMAEEAAAATGAASTPPAPTFTPEGQQTADQPRNEQGSVAAPVPPSNTPARSTSTPRPATLPPPVVRVTDTPVPAPRSTATARPPTSTRPPPTGTRPLPSSTRPPPTFTPAPPAVTQAPNTNTPVPFTRTPIPGTNTPAALTSTPVYTATPLPPVNTRIVPTSTPPAPPSDTPAPTYTPVPTSTRVPTAPPATATQPIVDTPRPTSPATSTPEPIDTPRATRTPRPTRTPH